MNIRRLLKTSRPRFWIYALGPYLIGTAAAMPSHIYTLWWSTSILVFFVFFTLPANIFTYGINDIFDYETDRLNPKKVAYESLILPKEQKKLWGYILVTSIPFLIYSVATLPTGVTLALLFFFVCAASYSTPPLRAKARPFWDSLVSGLHYISPGMFGYILGATITKTLFSYESFLLCLLGGFLWSAAMHAFSAVPDIDADKKAGVPTIATTLGQTHTIIFCMIFYFLSSAIMFRFLGIVGIMIGGVYIAVMLYSLGKNQQRIFAAYQIFPYVNTLVGMALFFFVLLR